MKIRFPTELGLFSFTLFLFSQFEAFAPSSLSFPFLPLFFRRQIFLKNFSHLLVMCWELLFTELSPFIACLELFRELDSSLFFHLVLKLISFFKILKFFFAKYSLFSLPNSHQKLSFLVSRALALAPDRNGFKACLLR